MSDIYDSAFRLAKFRRSFTDPCRDIFDEGMDDENICLAVLKTWEKMKMKAPERITDPLGTVSGMPG